MHLDATTYPARAGDVFLLCSDGLTDMVGEEQMLAVLTSEAGLRAESRRLVDLANEAGGRDNITVVVVELVDGPPVVGDGRLLGALFDPANVVDPTAVRLPQVS